VALEDMTYAEAAQALGIPIGILMSRLSRGRETLRRLPGRNTKAPFPSWQAAMPDRPKEIELHAYLDGKGGPEEAVLVITLLKIRGLIRREGYRDIFMVAVAIPVLAQVVLANLGTLVGSF
jgi:hypothetical protein